MRMPYDPADDGGVLSRIGLGGWARRRGPGGPGDIVGPQNKVHGAALGEDVVPGDPGLVPVLAVDLEALHVVRLVAAARRRDAQLPAAAEVDGQVVEPGGADQERRLAGHRVQPQHDPEDPALHGAGVAVARQAGGRGAVVRLGVPARVVDGQVLAADVVEQVRRREAGLVARVEQAVAEKGLEALDEDVGAAAQRHQRAQVVVRVERVLERQRLVVGVAPVAAAARDGVLGNEVAVRVDGPEEAREVLVRHVRVPLVAPVARAVQVLGRVRRLAQAAGHLVQAKVVARVLDGAGDGAPVPGRDVPEVDPVRQGAAALLGRRAQVPRVVVVGRHDLGVGHHGLERRVPVHAAADALDVGIGQDVVGVGAALRRAVEEGRARVGHEAVVAPDVDKRTKELLVGIWLDNVEQRCGAAELVDVSRPIFLLYH